MLWHKHLFSFTIKLSKGGAKMLSLFLFLGYDFDLAITLSEAYN